MTQSPATSTLAAQLSNTIMQKYKFKEPRQDTLKNKQTNKHNGRREIPNFKKITFHEFKPDEYKVWEVTTRANFEAQQAPWNHRRHRSRPYTIQP
jgi:hypothetical protein